MKSGSLLRLLRLPLLVLLFSLGAAIVPGASPSRDSQVAVAQPTEPPVRFIRNPEPVFRATGGPFIGRVRAIEITALSLSVAAKGQVRVRAVAFHRYRDIVRWSGARTFTIDLDREFYLVLVETEYIPRQGQRAEPIVCNWVLSVVDATDGTVRERHCGALEWRPQDFPFELRSVDD